MIDSFSYCIMTLKRADLALNRCLMMNRCFMMDRRCMVSRDCRRVNSSMVVCRHVFIICCCAMICLVLGACRRNFSLM